MDSTLWRKKTWVSFQSCKKLNCTSAAETLKLGGSSLTADWITSLIHLLLSQKGTLHTYTFLTCLCFCFILLKSYLMEDERLHLSSVRKTVATLSATVYWLNLLGGAPTVALWTWTCVCSEAGWRASLWIISISVSVPLNFTLGDDFALLTGSSWMQRVAFLFWYCLINCCFCKCGWWDFTPTRERWRSDVSVTVTMFTCSLENNQITETVQLKCLHGSHYLSSLMSLHSFFKYLINTTVSSIIVWSLNPESIVNDPRTHVIKSNQWSFDHRLTNRV